MHLNNSRRILEVVAVFATAIGKFVLMDALEWRFQFIVVVAVAWSVYIYTRWKKDYAILEYWGFRWDNFKLVIKWLLPLGLAAIITSFVIGYFRGTIIWSWHLIPVLILYPIWGTIQQFLCVGLVAGNLNDLAPSPIPKVLTIFLTASLFGLLHYPNITLVMGTFILALIYSITYLRSRNLYVLGLFHGWLGGIFYFTVVGKDPWTMVFH